MDKIFILKLVISFFVGGGFIALQTLLAEKFPRISGALLSLPSTVAITLIFIGWTDSVSAVVRATDIFPVAACAAIFFLVFYVYFFKIKFAKKIYSITFSWLISIGLWALISFGSVILKFDNFGRNLLIYAVSMAVAQYLVLRASKDTKVAELEFKYTYLQKIARWLFAGSIIAFAVLLSKIKDPLWGGAMSAFPAVYSSTVILLHYHRGRDFIASISRRIPYSSIVYVFYVIAVRYLYPEFGIILGTIFAYLLTLVVFYLVTKINKLKIFKWMN